MKKIIAANLIGLAAIAATPAMASVSNTGSTQIGGTLAQSCTISAPTGSTSNLDVTVNTSQPVGTVTSNCNFTNSVTIRVSTDHAGVLTATNGTAAYNIKVGAGTSKQFTSEQDAETISVSANADKTSALSVQIPNPPTVAGSYTDVIHLTINW